MKKLAILVSMIACSIAMDRPKSPRGFPVRVVNNNYYVKSGCSGKCGGHCNH